MIKGQTIKNIAMVGAGLANVATLYELIELIDKNARSAEAPEKLRGTSITIYDIRENFMGGLAYKASDPSLLFLRPIDIQWNSDAITNLFLRWVAENHDKWSAWLRSHDDPVINKWLDDNLEKSEYLEYKQIHYPRRLFGLFLDDLLHDTIQEAARYNIEIRLVEGKVDKISRDDKGYALSFVEPPKSIRVKKSQNGMGLEYESGHQSPEDIKPDTLVMGIGFGESRNFPIDGQTGYYSTQLDIGGESTKLKLRNEIEQRYMLNGNQPVAITAVGMGPAFCDFMYMLNEPSLRGKFNVTGISSTGTLPYDYNPPDRDFFPTSLKVAEAYISAKDLFDDLVREIESGSHLAHVFQILSVILKSDLVTDDIKDAFKREYGSQVRAMLPITSPAYAAAIAELASNGQLTGLKGTADIEQIAKLDSGKFSVPVDGCNVTPPADIVLNCAGPSRVKSRILEMFDFEITPNPRDLAANKLDKNIFLLGAAMSSFKFASHNPRERDPLIDGCHRHAKLVATHLFQGITGGEFPLRAPDVGHSF